MNQADLNSLNELWKSGALEDFIRRMLIYFDPMNLIVLGAPHDEYDADIPKIKDKILQNEITVDELSNFIFSLYKDSTGNVDDIEKKAKRMAEDLFDLKSS